MLVLSTPSLRSGVGYALTGLRASVQGHVFGAEAPWCLPDNSSVLHVYRTRKEVRRFPAEPHETVIAQRPSVVLVPTFHLQLTRPARGVFG